MLTVSSVTALMLATGWGCASTRASLAGGCMARRRDRPFARGQRKRLIVARRPRSPGQGHARGAALCAPTLGLERRPGATFSTAALNEHRQIGFRRSGDNVDEAENLSWSLDGLLHNLTDSLHVVLVVKHLGFERR